MVLSDVTYFQYLIDVDFFILSFVIGISIYVVKINDRLEELIDKCNKDHDVK